MRLNDIAEIILENVERLLPHLREDVLRYLVARKELGHEPNPNAYGGNRIIYPGLQNLYNFPSSGAHTLAGNQIGKNQLDKWINEAIEWALRADPRYLRDKKKQRPLDKTKAPFVRQILKWWLDPRADGGVELPEDIETVAETLMQFNVAKQHGLNADPKNFERWGDLVETLQPYLSEEEAGSDTYSRMGLELVFSSGPWKMYLVDEFIPGEESQLYPGQVCHRAFEGTSWCVKYQSTFENTYSGTYYLVLKNGKRFALINFPSGQFKNPQDRPIQSTNPKEGADFLTRLFTERPDFLAELSLNMLKGSGYYNDFRDFEQLFADEIKDVLNTPHAKEGALRDPTLIVSLAKRIGEWPSFKTWGEGYEKLVTTPIDGNGRQSVQELVEARGRVPEIESRMLHSGNSKEIRTYALWVSSSKPDQKAVNDLINIGRTAALRDAENPAKIRDGISWMSAEKALLGGEIQEPFPELEQKILEAQDPRMAYAYARTVGRRWPEGENLIASDDRSRRAYEKKILGRTLEVPGQEFKEPTDATGIVRRAILSGNDASEEEEEMILQDLDSAIMYAQEVIGPWPELEDKLRQEGTPQQKQQYSRNVLYGEFQ